MAEWYSTVYKAFIIASTISFIISLFTSGNTAFGSLVTAYSIIGLGIMMILLLLIQNILTLTEGQSFFKVIYEILISSGPLFLLLLIVGFMMYIILNYKSLIISGHVSSSYHSFLNTTTILILLQIYIIYSSINTPTPFKKISKITSGMLYLLAILTSACSLVIFSILKYFTTDGFKMK